MGYKSFMSYKSGVYAKHQYEVLPEGGHAVKIVGWGTEDGLDYWKVPIAGETCGERKDISALLVEKMSVEWSLWDLHTLVCLSCLAATTCLWSECSACLKFCICPSFGICLRTWSSS